jgi:hypothetical protein
MKCLVFSCLWRKKIVWGIFSAEREPREGLERHPAVAMACGRNEEYSGKPDPPSRRRTRPTQASAGEARVFDH